MRILFDIDGVICSNHGGRYEGAVPNPAIIELINGLYEDNTIILFTARGTQTGIDWRDFTERQLEDWGVMYHELIFGKPEADLYIDDKGVNVNDVWRVFT